MGRPKKVVKKVVEKVVEAAKDLIPTPKEEISLLSVDYTNEGLNNMARKINEIIIKING